MASESEDHSPDVIMPNEDHSSAMYRPRYSAEESSDAAFEEDERHRLCLGRKKSAKIVLFSFGFIFVVGVVTRVYLFFIGIRGSTLSGDIQMVNHHDIMERNETRSFWSAYWNKNRPVKEFDKARSDSNGFFDAIPDYEWKEMKHETKTMIDMQDDIIMRTSYLLTESGANINSHKWWVDNWKINFTCQNKALIGGKWICDPARILSIAADQNLKPNKPKWGKLKKRKPEQKECLVYVSGGRDMDFGDQFLGYSIDRLIELHDGPIGKDPLPCEVHIFSPVGPEIPETRDGLYIHHWGFRPSNRKSMGLAADNTTAIAFKTLNETILELGHSGKISILALDCEACEWDIYRDIVSLDEPIQQIVMQMHGTPYMANELFLAMQEAGYLIFHRERDPSGSGEVFDYSWLKLSPSYFNWMT